MMRIASAHLWVHDRSRSKFWTKKVGMEVREDVLFPEEMGAFAGRPSARQDRTMSAWC